MNQKEKKLKKKKFAIGIFLMLLLIESGIAAGISALYFRHTCIREIENLEKYTKNYSLALTDAFADVAVLSYKANDFTTLLTLFHQEIRENTIDEAFFALNDGKLIAHSSRDIEKSLNGNIANDEMTYNIDMILRPAKRNLKTIQFTSYNVMGKANPFTREERELIRKYIYDEIDMLGWLVSKAIFHKNVPVGTINFIIHKDRIFNVIQSRLHETKEIYIISQGVAVAVSLLISIVVVLRYRSIQKKTWEHYSAAAADELPEIIEIAPDKEIPAGSIMENGDEGDYITINLYDGPDEDRFQIEVIDDSGLDNFDMTETGTASGEGMPPLMPHAAYESERLINTSQIVQDAIPIEKKRH